MQDKDDDKDKAVAPEAHNSRDNVMEDNANKEDEEVDKEVRVEDKDSNKSRNKSNTCVSVLLTNSYSHFSLFMK